MSRNFTKNIFINKINKGPYRPYNEYKKYLKHKDIISYFYRKIKLLYKKLKKLLTLKQKCVNIYTDKSKGETKWESK